MKKKAVEKIQAGQAVALEGHTRIKLANAEAKGELAGIAARDIDEGEIVYFIPGANTKDIVTRVSADLIAIEQCPDNRHDYYRAFLTYIFCPYCGKRLYE